MCIHCYSAYRSLKLPSSSIPLSRNESSSRRLPRLPELLSAFERCLIVFGVKIGVLASFSISSSFFAIFFFHELKNAFRSFSICFIHDDVSFFSCVIDVRLV